LKEERSKNGESDKMQKNVKSRDLVQGQFKTRVKTTAGGIRAKKKKKKGGENVKAYKGETGLSACEKRVEFSGGVKDTGEGSKENTRIKNLHTTRQDGTYDSGEARTRALMI